MDKFTGSSSWAWETTESRNVDMTNGLEINTRQVVPLTTLCHQQRSLGPNHKVGFRADGTASTYLLEAPGLIGCSACLRDAIIPDINITDVGLTGNQQR